SAVDAARTGGEGGKRRAPQQAANASSTTPPIPAGSPAAAGRGRPRARAPGDRRAAAPAAQGAEQQAAEDPAQIALQLNGMSMDGLLAALQARGKAWINQNQGALVHTPGVGPQRMALAVEAVLAAPIAQEERLA